MEGTTRPEYIESKNRSAQKETGEFKRKYYSLFLSFTVLFVPAYLFALDAFLLLLRIFFSKILSVSLSVLLSPQVLQ